MLGKSSQGDCLLLSVYSFQNIDGERKKNIQRDVGLKEMIFFLSTFPLPFLPSKIIKHAYKLIL